MAKKTEEKKVAPAEIKKISVKTVIGCKPQLNREEDRLDLMRIVGMAVGTKVVSTTYGDSIGLRGQFEAINVATGEVFRASTAWLPDLIIDPISAALMSEDCNGIQFGYDIAIVRDDSSATGYVYECTSLIKAQNDPLAALSAQVAELKPLQIA